MSRLPVCVQGDALMDHLEALDERLYLAEARERHANSFERGEKRRQRQWFDKDKPARTGERIGYVVLA
jgi:hypothetical protein